MRAQPVVVVVVEALDGCVLDRTVHPFDLAAIQENDPPDRFLIFMASRVVGLGQPMLLAPRLVPPRHRAGAICIRHRARTEGAFNGSSLQAPVQRRARQVRDGRLQGIKTVVRRQQRMTPECDDRRFFGLGQNRRARLFRTRL